MLRTHGRPNVNPDDKVDLAVDPANVHLFDRGNRTAADRIVATVTQADEGVDLDVIVGKSGAKVGRPSH